MIDTRHKVIIERRDSHITARIINIELPIEEHIKTKIQRALSSETEHVCSLSNYNAFVSGKLSLKAFRASLQHPVSILLIATTFIIDEEGQYTTVPPFGIWKIASHLSTHSNYAATTIFDTNIAGKRSLQEILEASSYDVVGVAVMPANIANDANVLHEIRTLQPNAIIVAGGVASSTLAQWDDNKHLDCDVIITRSATTAFVDLVDDIAHGIGIPTKIIHGSERDSVLAFDENIIPYGVGDNIHQIGYSSHTLYHKFSNACRENCFWCTSPKDGVSIHDPTKAVQTLVSRYRPEWHTELVIVDNNLCSHPHYIRRVCERISYSPIATLPKHGKSTITGLTDELILEFAHAGFVRMSLGIESYDERVRNELGKHYTNIELEHKVDMLSKNGIRPEINLILFSPFETHDSLVHTIDCAVDMISVSNGWLLVTLGLHCVVGRPTEQGLDVLYREVNTSNDTITVPSIYKPGTEVEALYQKVSQRYARQLQQMCYKNVPNHVKSLLKLIITADTLGRNEARERLETILTKQQNEQYIYV